MTARLAVLLRWGTVAASAVLAVGTVLWWTPWLAAARHVIIAAVWLFVALPVAGLLLVAAAYVRRRDVLYVLVTATVTALVVVDAIVGGLLS